MQQEEARPNNAGAKTEANTSAPIDVTAKDATFEGSNGDQLLFLDLEEITVPDEIDIRPYTNRLGPTEKETEELENLQRSIIEVGQIQPVKVRYNADGGYDLIAGRRRYMAVSMINAAKAKGETPLRLACVISRETSRNAKALRSRGYREADHENRHRSNLSPMDEAENIRFLRSKFKGNREKVTKQIAAYLCVSPATVTQYEKLLTLPEDKQLLIHNGEISRDAAFVLAKVAPERQDEVLAAAKEMQVEEAAQAKAAGKKKVRDGKTVKSRHVKKAAAKTGATDAITARNKKEIVDWIQAAQGPVSGNPEKQPMKFLQMFERWCGGQISDRALDKAWYAVVEACGAKIPKAKAKATGSKRKAKK